MQISNIIYDGFVFLTGCYGFYINWKAQRVASVGFLLAGLAGLLGSIKYAGFVGIQPVHGAFSGAAAMIGLPLIAYGFFSLRNSLEEKKALIILAVLLVFFVLFRFIYISELYRTVVSGLSILLILVVCIAEIRRIVSLPVILGIIGAIVVPMSGLLIGTEGYLWGIQRLDLFHYFFGVGLTSIAVSLRMLSR